MLLLVSLFVDLGQPQQRWSRSHRFRVSPSYNAIAYTSLAPVAARSHLQMSSSLINRPRFAFIGIDISYDSSSDETQLQLHGGRDWWVYGFVRRLEILERIYVFRESSYTCVLYNSPLDVLHRRLNRSLSLFTPEIQPLYPSFTILLWLSTPRLTIPHFHLFSGHNVNYSSHIRLPLLLLMSRCTIQSYRQYQPVISSHFFFHHPQTPLR